MNNRLTKITMTLIMLFALTVPTQAFAAENVETVTVSINGNGCASNPEQLIKKIDGLSLQTLQLPQTKQLAADKSNTAVVKQTPAAAKANTAAAKADTTETKQTQEAKTTKTTTEAAKPADTTAKTTVTKAEPAAETAKTTAAADKSNDAANKSADVSNSNTAPSQTSTNIGAYEQQVVDLVNKERAAEGLSALKMNTKLAGMAEKKAEDLRDNNYFDHTSPVYGSPFDMMRQFGISYTAAGENIAKGQKTPEAVMDGWMNSPGHRANILNANYTEIGVGYVTDNNGTGYWVQEFIRP